MKTTLDIDDELLAKAKAASAREKKTLTALIEEGLRLRLRRRPAATRKTRSAARLRWPRRLGAGHRPHFEPLDARGDGR